MRLAIVRKRFDPYGGAERFITTAAGALIGRGVEVTVITEAWDGGEVEGLRRLVLPKGGGFGRAGKLRRFQLAAAAAVGAGGFDLVQSHERMVGADLFRAGDGVHAAWLERLGRERGWARAQLLRLDPMHRLVTATERAMAADERLLFVANSALVAGEIRDFLAVPDRRIRVIENGVDLDRFRPASPAERAAARTGLGVAQGEPLVAFVGSGFERKGAFRLVEALALPALGGVRAVIAGRDRKIEALRRRVARLGLEARVAVLGGVGDVRSILAAADVLALPTLYDPMPNAALEAIACGLPVVTCEGAGIAAPLAASGAGVVTTRDPDDLAAGLAQALGAREAMAARALDLRARFDLGAATRAWQRLYDELLAERGRR
jgi:UDP-glucose:(heptosyl)LPS alpha-1,3-glucosyltransferase